MGRRKSLVEATHVTGVAEARICRRLNWGWGDWIVPGRVNSDLKGGDGVVACHIRAGLTFEDESFDYAVSIHALPELTTGEFVPALKELRTVFAPGGTLRLGLPNLELSLDAYRRGDRASS
jgi:predicted SAM-dependent methyltransferase